VTARFELPEAAKRYRIYGLDLASELVLPELIPLAGSDLARATDITVRMEIADPSSIPPLNWFAVFLLPGGEPGLTCAKEPAGYRLRFPELADFRVDYRGREIICEAPEGLPPATIRHLLLDHVIPRTLSLLGIEALHATAVLTPYGVCAFTGATGVGKSTLAASFHLAGYPVLSDDCLVLSQDDDPILATPAYPGVRLWDDALAALCDGLESGLPVAHNSSKLRVLADTRQRSFTRDRMALARIYDLVPAPEEGEEVGVDHEIVEAMSGREAIMSLLTSVFPFDITDRQVLARQFEFFDRVASRVPVRRLHVPEGFSSLPAVRDAIFADLRASGSGAM